MKYFSMFSGIGGFELGIDNYGECIGYSEIDKYAIQIYEQHFNHKNYGDATTINPKELPDFDLLVGGFPCQAFSIAGKRRGFDDTRGTLFFDIARIAKAKKPLRMLLENVKGLVSHDGGKTLETILLALQELGYYVNIEVYNSKDFGVPQNRERIFFQCHSIRLLDGLSQKTTSSKNIIEQYLFQLLLNNLKEVQKLQETASKDWVVGYLLYREISQSQKLSEENTSDGTSIVTADGLFQLKDEDPWQSIVTLLSSNLGEDLSAWNTSIISTAINRIIQSEIYTYSQMQTAIWLATVLLRQSSNHLWNEVLSNLIVIKEDTKYARINDKTEEVIITEYGTAHKLNHFQDFSRYFIIGHFGGCCGPKVFPIRSTDEVHTRPNQTEEEVHQLAQTLTARQFASWNGNYIKEITQGQSQGMRVYDPEGISTTLASQAGGLGAKTGLYAIPVLTPDRPNARQQGRRLKENGDPSFTLTSQDQHGVFDGVKIRKLTPVECERLQGFPDNWTAGVSDTQRYKTLGNGVTVNVVSEIVKRLYADN